MKVSTVPLRIASAAGEAFDQRLALAWKSVSDQPIEINSVANDQLLDVSGKADVVIFVNRQMGDLQAVGALSPMPDVMLGADGLDTQAVLPALAADALPWGTEVYSIPLGAVYPAVWHSGDVMLSGTPTWADYRQVVESLEKGQSAEPLADGWAAISFLWRAGTLTKELWLFDRQTAEPQITSEPYVRALEELVDASKHYPDQRLSPDEIWAGLTSGSIKLAIAWPTIKLIDLKTLEEGKAVETLSLSSYPQADQVYLSGWVPSDGQPLPPMLDSNGLSAGIATSCRQTQVARTFLNWLSTHDGHAALRGPDNIVLPNRTKRTVDDEDGGMNAFAGISADPNYAAYDDYLQTVLSQSVVRPSFRIPGSTEYLQTLDREVLAAISGEKSAREALETAASEWNKITEDIGRRGQINAWRQSQGMRER